MIKNVHVMLQRTDKWRNQDECVRMALHAVVVCDTERQLKRITFETQTFTLTFKMNMFP